MFCEFCGKRLIVTEVDKAEGTAWVCCPEFVQGNDEHDGFQVKLTQAVYEEFLQGQVKLTQAVYEELLQG